MDWSMILIAAASGIFGSTGFFWWLATSRKLNTSEYRALVQDLQRERTARNADIERLQKALDTQDAEISVLRVALAATDVHVEWLEGIIRTLGGDVPARPKRRSPPSARPDGPG